MHFTGLEYPIAAESKRRSVLQWHDTLDLLAPSRRARLVSALVITAFPMNVAILVSTPNIRTSSSVVSACKPPSSSIAASSPLMMVFAAVIRGIHARALGVERRSK